MAIVQISKIQQRRGQKYSNTGVPQLSSAEFAWAVDSQELFIGNGSIAEGAPYVGNTKILTEHDNIVELLTGYQFALNNPAITGTVPRSLQDKFDEYVSVFDFGAVADGVTDNTLAFQTALDQLFLNDSSDQRLKRKLIVPPGEYKFAGNLYIPSEAYIQGENPASVVLNFGDFGMFFKAGNAPVPEKIKLAELTLQFSTSGFVDISSLYSSLFENVTITSSYTLGDSLTGETGTVVWRNEIAGTSATDVIWRNCNFKYLPIAFECTQVEAFETSIVFEFCKFLECGIGISIDGVSGQFNSWEIRNCNFTKIAAQALLVPYGHGTQVIQCTFEKCGNGTNEADTPVTFIIEFGEGATNIVRSCKFDRLMAAGVSASFTQPAITEVRGGGLVEIIDRVETDIYLADSYRPLAVFSALNSSTMIEYTLVIGTNVRRGTITLGVNKDRSSFTISDNYQHSTGDVSMTEFNFGGSLHINFPSDITDSTPDTLVLTYENPTLTGHAGSISYSVTYSV